MTDFSPEVCDAICEDIADGVSLREACRKEGRPSKTSFLRWLGDPERGALRDQYARAREAQADHYADAIIDIVDNDPDPTRARVRMDGRKWVASKLLPKKYGDKLAVGGDAEAGPVRVIVERRIVDPVIRPD